MQTLDVISVNLWQILISLINLALLFLILKKFLFKPVTRVLERRQSELDEQYGAAEEAEARARENERAFEEKLSHAQEEADAILSNAAENAKRRSEQLLKEAEARADGMLRAAENEIELQRKKAESAMKKEIVEVSHALAEKLLSRELSEDDHRAAIDDFLEKIGDEQ